MRLMVGHVLRRLVALPVESVGQGNVLDVLRQIGFYIKVNGHFLALVGEQGLFSKTKTFCFDKIQTGFRRGDVIGRLAGDSIAVGVHCQVQGLAGYAQVIFENFFLGLEMPRQ